MILLFPLQDILVINKHGKFLLMCASAQVSIGSVGIIDLVFNSKLKSLQINMTAWTMIVLINEILTGKIEIVRLIKTCTFCLYLRDIYISINLVYL